jgi:hypothetical protein
MQARWVEGCSGGSCRQGWPDAPTILCTVLGGGVGEDYSGCEMTVVELVNWFGAAGWEVAGLQEFREDGGVSSFEVAWLLTM